MMMITIIINNNNNNPCDFSHDTALEINKLNVNLILGNKFENVTLLFDLI